MAASFPHLSQLFIPVRETPSYPPITKKGRCPNTRQRPLPLTRHFYSLYAIRLALSKLLLLLKVEPPRCGTSGGSLLRQSQLQHAVVVAAADFFALHVGDVKAAAEGTVGTLPAQVIALVILLLGLSAALGGDGQAVTVDIYGDVLFLHTGQICFQFIVIALILDIGVEPCGVPIAKEGLLKVLQIPEGIVHGHVISTFKRHHIKHTHKS